MELSQSIKKVKATLLLSDFKDISTIKLIINRKHLNQVFQFMINLLDVDINEHQWLITYSFD